MTIGAGVIIAGGILFGSAAYKEKASYPLRVLAAKGILKANVELNLYNGSALAGKMVKLDGTVVDKSETPGSYDIIGGKRTSSDYLIYLKKTKDAVGYIAEENFIAVVSSEYLIEELQEGIKLSLEGQRLQHDFMDAKKL